MSIQALLDNTTTSRSLDLIDIARSGIASTDLRVIKEYTYLTDKDLSRILPISYRQLLRYDDDHILNKGISSHLIQIVDLFSQGYKLFGEEKFRKWIRTDNTVLNNNKPIDIMDTSLGIEMIEDVIGRIQYGVFS